MPAFSARSARQSDAYRAENSGAGAPGAPDALTVDGTAAAVGVDPGDVEFAWHVVDGRRGARQHAYRVLVATAATTDAASTAIVWDSGPVTSSRQAFVTYGGTPLAADTDYWWTVATADPSGTGATFGPFARPAHFVTGLTTTGPGIGSWRAEWVRPGPASPQGEEYAYVRTAAKLGASPIVRATASVAAAHQYQLWINGARADSGPSFSYPDEQYVQAADVTRFVRAGATNVIGVLHHWYGAGQGRPVSAPGLLVQVSVLHADGTRDVIGTDGTWRQHPAEWQPAPLRNEEGDHVEHVDGRASPLGWSTAAYDDSAWTPVPVLGPVGTAPFTGLAVQRTRVVEHAAAAGLGPPVG